MSFVHRKQRIYLIDFIKNLEIKIFNIFKINEKEVLKYLYRKINKSCIYVRYTFIQRNRVFNKDKLCIIKDYSSFDLKMYYYVFSVHKFENLLVLVTSLFLYFLYFVTNAA